MTTINLSRETKNRFRELRLKLSGKEGKSISEDEFEKVLLDNYEEKKK